MTTHRGKASTPIKLIAPYKKPWRLLSPFVQSCIFLSSFLFTLSVSLSLPSTVLPSVGVIPVEENGRKTPLLRCIHRYILCGVTELEQVCKYDDLTSETQLNFRQEMLTVKRGSWLPSKQKGDIDILGVENLT